MKIVSLQRDTVLKLAVAGVVPDQRRGGQKLPHHTRLVAVSGTPSPKPFREVEPTLYVLAEDDLIVYTPDTDIHKGEVLSAYARHILPAGVKVLVVYSRDTDTLYTIGAPFYRSLENYEINLVNRIEMALGARGIVVGNFF